MRSTLRELAAGFRSGFSASADADRDPMAEEWWEPGGWTTGGSATGPSSSGITVTPQLAFQVSCFFLGVKLIAETISTIPLKFYREIGDDEKELARDYWLRPVLDTKRGIANAWQTAQQWREAAAARMIAWGAGISEIKPGQQGRPLDFWLLDNDRTQSEQLADGRLRFKVTRDDGHTDTLAQDQVCRIEGLSLHRFVPANVLALARECIGVWLAVERYEGLFFAQGARPSLFLEHPGKPDKPTMDRLRENVQAWQGLRNMFKVFIGEQGMKPTQIGFSPRDAMLPEQRQELALEVCRWLNMPPHMLKAGGSSGTEEAAASMEQLAQEYVDYTVRPLSVRIEACYQRDLISEPDIYAEHILEGLLRGDTLKRFQAYQIGIMNGFMAENEARVRENLPKAPGLDQPRRSVNQDRGADPRQSDPRQTQPGQGSAPPRRLALVVRCNAESVVRKEIAAILDKAAKLANDPEAWGAWVRDFYGVSIYGYVLEKLQLEPLLARKYTDRHRAALLAEGVKATERWPVEAVEELTRLTIEEPIHG